MSSKKMSSKTCGNTTLFAQFTFNFFQVVGSQFWRHIIIGFCLRHFVNFYVMMPHTNRTSSIYVITSFDDTLVLKIAKEKFQSSVEPFGIYTYDPLLKINQFMAKKSKFFKETYHCITRFSLKSLNCFVVI